MRDSDEPLISLPYLHLRDRSTTMPSRATRPNAVGTVLQLHREDPVSGRDPDIVGPAAAAGAAVLDCEYHGSLTAASEIVS